MGQGHNNQGTADVDTVHMSVSRLVNTWQGHQVAPLKLFWAIRRLILKPKPLTLVKCCAKYTALSYSLH